jgi:hypothetical protein
MRTVWLVATLLLFVPAAADWSQFLKQHPLARPTTPIDLGQPTYASYWRFLRSARQLIPIGSSYTIKAADVTAEHELYMLSLALFSGIRPYPSSYLFAQQPGGGAEAQHVLMYGSCECPADAKTMRPVEGGCVCTR